MRADRRRWLAGLALAASLPACATDPQQPSAPGGAARPAPTPAPEPAPQGLEEVPYVQTPDASVDAMLDLAEMTSADRLLDLGSGDGRVVIRAATRFKVPGMGVEIDPGLVDLSRELARKAGVASLTRFAVQDLFDTDLSQATVITLYLLPDVNLALRPRLLKLAPGTRIVSHDWDMADWLPDRSVVVPAPGKPVGLRKESQLHRWTVPAVIEGLWHGRIEGRPEAELEIRIVQQFQRIGVHWRASGDGGRGRSELATADARLQGSRATLSLQGSGSTRQASLVAGERRLEGRVRTADGERNWWARRLG